MKNLQIIIKQKFLPTFLSLVLLFTSIPNLSAKTFISKFDKSLTGEEIFREVFFFQSGNFPKSTPTSIKQEFARLNNMSTKQKMERRKNIDNIVDLINVSNPNYFDDLKKSIQSKNPYKVKSQISKGGRLILNVLNLQNDYEKIKKYLASNKIDLSDNANVTKLLKDLELDLNNKTSKNLNQDVSGDQCLAAVIATFLITYVAVAVLATYVDVYSEQNIEERNNLSKEQYINSIIANYSE